MREYKAMQAAERYVGGWGKRKKRVQSSALETHDLLDEGTGERAHAICMRDVGVPNRKRYALDPEPIPRRLG
jgi:hypothetical protein